MTWLETQTSPATTVVPLPEHCNSGGPRSRSRQEWLSATVLGRQTGTIRCPCSTVLALDFEGADPLATVNDLLDKAGFAGPEELRTYFQPPEMPAICRPNKDLSGIRVAAANPGQVLQTALLLGLCTPWLYDPSRPVLWTRASLERRLELFDGEGFYA
jgi:hypothetical protein